MKKPKHADSGSILIVVFMPVLGAFCGWIGPWWSALLFFFWGIYTVKAEPDKTSGDSANTKAGPKTDSARKTYIAPSASTDEPLLNVDWEHYQHMIEEAWKKGDYDLARTWLQKLAYDLTNRKAPDDVHAGYKKLMAAFAREDPLFSSVMNEVTPLIKAQPGIVQSALMKKFPQFGPEEFRYVMYYAEIVGMLRREKKGRSYALFVP